ncbi:MAG: LysM peptidoglycan-binding domain-containing protein [Clostridia bacterium]|nr:LysM peptidoglycan-binding domain-containing protein [Clostridia bacterium]
MNILLIHTVQSGDTLYEIGKKYGITIEQLIKANGNTVLPTLIVGQSVIVPTATEKTRSVLTNGYAYPNIRPESLEGFAPMLSLITPFSYGITDDGALIPTDDAALISDAEDLGISPLLIVTSLTESGSFSSERAARILGSAELTDTLIQSIITQLEKYDYYGVDVDFEYIPPQYGSSYSEFIKTLKARLAPLGYKVFVSVAPKTSRGQRGLLYEAHDYKSLGEAADYVLVMTYEWGYTYGPPMAVAPIDKVRQVLTFASEEIPPEKLLMGIPNYAYDWTLPFEKGRAAESMSNAEAVERARRVGANIEFDGTAKTPFYRYFDDAGRQHEVWFEDARSIQAKFSLLAELSLAGFSVWNIMSFYRPLDTLATATFNITKI